MKKKKKKEKEKTVQPALIGSSSGGLASGQLPGNRQHAGSGSYGGQQVGVEDAIVIEEMSSANERKATIGSFSGTAGNGHTRSAGSSSGGK